MLFGLEKKAFIFITVKGFCIYLILLTRIFLVFFSDSRGLFNGASAHAKRYLKREIVLTLTCYTFYFLTFIFGMLYIAALRPRWVLLSNHLKLLFEGFVIDPNVLNGPFFFFFDGIYRHQKKLEHKVYANISKVYIQPSFDYSYSKPPRINYGIKIFRTRFDNSTHFVTSESTCFWMDSKV